MTVTIKSAQGGSGPGIPVNRTIPDPGAYKAVNCPSCCAVKGRPCRNKFGEVITKVHYQRALAADLARQG